MLIQSVQTNISKQKWKFLNLKSAYLFSTNVLKLHLEQIMLVEVEQNIVRKHQIQV